MSESYGYLSLYCSTIPSQGTNFNLVDNKGNYLGQKYASPGFYYSTTPSPYRYHLESDGTLASTSSDHLCPQFGYATFVQSCSSTVKCAVGNDLTLKCIDGNGTPFNFGETSDGYVKYGQGTDSGSNTPITISVSPSEC